MTQPAASSSSDLPATADALVAELLALYAVIENDLLTQLGVAGRSRDAAALLDAFRQIVRRAINVLIEQVPPLVDRVIAETARDAEQAADTELVGAGSAPPTRPPDAAPVVSGGRPAPHRVDLLRDLPPARRSEADDLTRRLLATAAQFSRLAQDAYRAAVLDQLPDVLAGRDTTQVAQGRAWRDLTSRGVTGFTDARGRRWNLASYVEMATRTATQRTFNAVQLERYVAQGITQVAVPQTGHPCPLCKPWEGKVLSIDPAGPSPTIAEAEAAGLHHPNCRHTWLPYLPGVTRLPRPKPWTQVDQDRYAATERLRYLERQTRAAKRVALAATNDLDRRRAVRKQRALQANIRAHVARHSLVRRPRRERINLGNS